MEALTMASLILTESSQLKDPDSIIMPRIVRIIETKRSPHRQANKNQSSMSTARNAASKIRGRPGRGATSRFPTRIRVTLP